MLLTRQQPDAPAAALNKFCPVLTQYGLYTEFGIDPISAVYPKSQVQRCIIHQIRSSTRFVSYKDIKPLMADLKKVYTAVTEDEALENLTVFKEKWANNTLPVSKAGRTIGIF